MKLTIVIASVLCACVLVSAGDVAQLKAAKARLVGRLTGKGKHHKRGVLSAIPTFKLGHDIPLITHSIVKPLVVTYPPTASVTAVKVPLAHPLGSHYPTSLGHKVHPHHGFKSPHNTLLVPKPDHHYHHHHHHVAPRPPIAPVVPATPVVPFAQPTGAVAHPVPAPPPPVVAEPASFVPSSIVPAPIPVAPPPVPIIPPNHVQLRPVLHAAPVPIQPTPVVPSPLLPLASQFPYVIRPGNAIQTSLFATYPRYPLVNYQTPFIPFTAPPAPAPVGQVFLDRPHVPHFHHLVPQADAHDGVFEQHVPAIAEPTHTHLHPTQTVIPQPALHLQPVQPAVHLQPTQPTVHLQPAQPAVHLQPTQPSVPIEHDGWSPVPAQPHDLTPAHPQDAHHFLHPQEGHHITQEQATQVFEHHTDEQQYHDYQHQLQHHIQQQIEQAQYDQHINNQHQLNQEYGVPQDYNNQQQVSQEYGQPNQDYLQHNQDFSQHALSQQQPDHEYGAPQQLGQDYNLHQQGFEGRSADGEGETQRYHNHIPLGLQPPIDRPLEHFR